MSTDQTQVPDIEESTEDRDYLAEIQGIGVTEVLRRAGLLQETPEEFAAGLGHYIYAYYDTEIWSSRFDSAEDDGDESDHDEWTVSNTIPAPLIIGIGTGTDFTAPLHEALNGDENPKLDIIRELIADGLGPDIRFLDYGRPAAGRAGQQGAAEDLKLILGGIFGSAEANDGRQDFLDRMGFPKAPELRMPGSRRPQTATLAALSAGLRSRTAPETSFRTPDEIVELTLEQAEVDNVLFIGISGAYSMQANTDQLKVATCEWWNSRSICPNTAPDRAEGRFAVIGWTRDPDHQWEVTNDPTGKLHRSIPLIRSVFLVEEGGLDQWGDRVSFTHRSEYDEDLWRLLVGTRIDRTTNQMQGQKWNRVGVESQGRIETLTS